MRILKKIFTWWEGATIGTSLWSWRNGRLVGEDGFGNRYFETRKSPRRRWVIYAGSNDASNVPAEWHGWLHGTFEEPPDEALPPSRDWEMPYFPNLTGSPDAYRPAGALERGARRASATGDYEAWAPEA